MCIHFISPASVEFTRQIAEWRRQPWRRNEMAELSERLMADLRPWSKRRAEARRVESSIECQNLG